MSNRQRLLSWRKRRSIGGTNAESHSRREMAGRGMKLATVICNSSRPGSPDGFPEVNAKCSECGKEVWCNPLFLGAEVKLCLKCDPYITE